VGSMQGFFVCLLSFLFFSRQYTPCLNANANGSIENLMTQVWDCIFWRVVLECARRKGCRAHGGLALNRCRVH
jgi:hypothetical protein